MKHASNSGAQAPVHGGDIDEQARRLGIDADSLTDLSTGVSPFPYPLPAMPPERLTRMPYPSPALAETAARYYRVGVAELLPVAGSQQAIQLLPRLCSPGRVLLPRVGYQEHAYRWQRAGHEAVFYRSHDRWHIAALIAEHRPRALVLIHPNNPTGEYVDREDVLHWRRLLPADGTIVIDEAFIDPTPERSVADLLPLPGLVILRSAGKFFGLPGLRLGFALGEPDLLRLLQEELGPWPVSSQAQWAGERMLGDTAWQWRARQRLLESSDAFARRLESGLQPFTESLSVTPLFTSAAVAPAIARSLYESLLRQRFLVRHYAGDGHRDWLRFGMSADAAVTERLAAVLQQMRDDSLQDGKSCRSGL